MCDVFNNLWGVVRRGQDGGRETSDVATGQEPAGSGLCGPALAKS